jgi:hypothetical protein
LRPWYAARSHWFILAPTPLPAAPLAFALMAPLFGDGEALYVVPMAAGPFALFVIAWRKDRSRPRPILNALGHEGLSLDRLEEQMAAGKDVLLLSEDPDLVCEAVRLVRPVLEG